MAQALIPFNEAAAEWTKATGEESWVAAIYLPAEYETCEKCTAMETHEHPNKQFVTREELDEAIEEKLRSDYEARHGL